MHRLIMVCEFVGLLALQACTSAPDVSAVESAIRVRVIGTAAIELRAVANTDGIARPGENGAPDMYTVEFRAEFVPTAAVMIDVAGGSADSAEGGAMIKRITTGVLPEPGASIAPPGPGEGRLPLEPGPAIPVTGAVQFVKTDSGWRAGEVTALLPDSLAQRAHAFSRRVLEGYVTMMKSDLRNLITAQEAYRSEHKGRYAPSVAALGATYRSSDGVEVEISGTTAKGWTATARSPAVTAVVCRISVGGDALGEGEALCR